MRCTRVQEIISAFVDSEANPLEQLAMQEHVKSCSVCKRALADQYTLKSLVKTVKRTDPSVDLSANIMKRLSTRTPEISVPRKYSGIVAAAMMAVVLLVATISVRFENEHAVPPVIADAMQTDTLEDKNAPEYAEYIYQHLADNFAYAGQTNYIK